MSSISSQPDDSLLASVFFSLRNISMIQDAIVRVVLYTHGTRIDSQPEADILRIMRSVYLQHNKDVFRTDISTVSRIISEMNEIVVRDSVKLIDEEMAMKARYTADFDRVRIPMPYPANVSSKGDRSLELTK